MPRTQTLAKMTPTPQRAEAHRQTREYCLSTGSLAVYLPLYSNLSSLKSLTHRKIFASAHGSPR